MKISCKIIEDLLPLYYDNICSNESKELIDEHLKECEHCKKTLDEISNTLPIENKKPIEPLKSVSDKWLKFRKKSLIKGLIIGVSICLVLVTAFFALTQWRIIPVNADKFEVTDLCELSDGQIAFHLYVDDNYNLHTITVDITDDNVMYITPKRGVIEDRRRKEFNAGFFDRDYVVSVSGNVEWYTDFNYMLTPVKAVYIGTKNNNILLWDENTDIPLATAEQNQRYTDNTI